MKKAIQKLRGVAVIGDTKIPVWRIAKLRSMGRSTSEIASNFPALSHEDIVGACEYYNKNTKEIDDDIAKHSKI